MKSEKLEYTVWLYFIGAIGLLLGAQGCVLIAILAPDKLLNEITIIYAFLLIAAILFLFVKREMTYLIYTGMFAVLCVFRTFTPLIFGPPYPGWTFFIGSVPYWLCLGYLSYKYLDFRKIFAEKGSYKRIYEEPYKRKKEVKTESIPYFYKVLGVSKNATLEEIKNAYRRLAKIYHPDVSADPDAEKKFKEIQKAYDTLSDPHKRAQYDRFEDSYKE